MKISAYLSFFVLCMPLLAFGSSQGAMVEEETSLPKDIYKQLISSRLDTEQQEELYRKAFSSATSEQKINDIYAELHAIASLEKSRAIYLLLFRTSGYTLYNNKKCTTREQILEAYQADLQAIEKAKDLAMQNYKSSLDNQVVKETTFSPTDESTARQKLMDEEAHKHQSLMIKARTSKIEAGKIEHERELKEFIDKTDARALLGLHYPYSKAELDKALNEKSMQLSKQSNKKLQDLAKNNGYKTIPKPIPADLEYDFAKIKQNVVDQVAKLSLAREYLTKIHDYSA